MFKKDIKGNYEVVRRGFKNSIGQEFLVLEPGEFTVYDMNDPESTGYTAGWGLSRCQ